MFPLLISPVQHNRFMMLVHMASALPRTPLLPALQVLLVAALCTAQANELCTAQANKLCTPQANHRDIALRCCVVVDKPFVFWKPDVKSPPPPPKITDFEGIAIEVFNSTVQCLCQQNTTLRCASVETFSAEDGKGVASNALVQHLARCDASQRNATAQCRCDIGIGGWFETPNRTGVKFLPAYIYDAVRVAVPWKLAQSGASNNLFFLLAFDADVWSAIALLIALFTALKVLDSRFAEAEAVAANAGLSAAEVTAHPGGAPGAPPTDGAGEGRGWVLARMLRSVSARRAEKVRYAFQSTLNNLLGFCFLELDEERKTTRQWLINYIIALCGLFLVLVYEATMTARLVQENNDTQFRFPRDFTSCKINASEVCYIRGDFMEQYWADVITKHHCHRRLEEENGVQQGPTRFDDFDEMFSAVQSGRCNYMIGGGGQIGTATELEKCGQIAPAGEAFLTRGVSMVVPRSSEHTGLLANVTLGVVRLRSDRTSVGEYFAELGSCRSPEGVQLTFRVMRVYFATAFGACFFMLVHMVVVRVMKARQDAHGSDASSSSQ